MRETFKSAFNLFDNLKCADNVELYLFINPDLKPTVSNLEEKIIEIKTSRELFFYNVTNFIFSSGRKLKVRVELFLTCPADASSTAFVRLIDNSGMLPVCYRMLEHT